MRNYVNLKFTASAKNSNLYRAAAHRHKRLLLFTKQVTGILCLVQFNELWASIGVSRSFSSHPFLCALENTRAWGKCFAGSNKSRQQLLTKTSVDVLFQELFKYYTGTIMGLF